MKLASIKHEFVESAPHDLEDGKLYVSISFRTAIHLCACGCKNKVVTPLRPARWKLYFDGDTVSLSPSVGNWQFPCKSHYWIERDKIRWAKPWTDKQIAEGRMSDTEDLQLYYEGRRESDSNSADQLVADENQTSLLTKIWRRIHR